MPLLRTSAKLSVIYYVLLLAAWYVGNMPTLHAEQLGTSPSSGGDAWVQFEKVDASSSPTVEPWVQAATMNAEVEAERQFRASLQSQTRVDFVEMPLIDVLRTFEQSTRRTIVIDQQALGNMVDQPVSYYASEVSAGVALTDIFRELGLAWHARADGSVLVTTSTVEDLHVPVRVYAVRDLVTNEFPTYVTEDPNLLIELVTSMIHPTSWSDVGGAGGIKYFTASGALVISQTREAHEEIEKLLAGLRQVRDAQGGTRPLVDGRDTSSGGVPYNRRGGGGMFSY